MTSSATNLDDITASLFYQLRDKNCVYDLDILQCPKCPERLEALELDVYKENGQTFQRIWWTCRGIKNQSCHFPLWVPREVFWTRRNEEQMKTGYIPLPNIHLLPQRLWYLYPNIFRDKLNEKEVTYVKKDGSGIVTPSSDHTTRGSSVRPESVLTENDECSRDTFPSTPLHSTDFNNCLMNEVETRESEVPVREIRIDDDLEDELRTCPIKKKENVKNQETNVEVIEREVTSEESSSDSSYIHTTNLSSNSHARPSDEFYLQMNSCEQLDSEILACEIPTDNIDQDFSCTSLPVNISQSSKNVKRLRVSDDVHNSEVLGKRSRNVTAENEFNEETAVICKIPRTKTPHDLLDLLLSSASTYTSKSKIIMENKDVLEEKYVAKPVDDIRVIASLVKELVFRVAVEHDYFCDQSICEKELPNKLSKAISLEEARKDFGDLTLKEFMDGVSSLQLSVIADPNEQRPSQTNISLEPDNSRNAFYTENIDSDAITDVCTEFATDLNVKSLVSKRRSNNKNSRFSSVQNLPIDEKCIAAVEMALKNSINNMKGPEVSGSSLRTPLLKGSLSEFSRNMISDQIFDPLNWRRPVRFGGHTNLDAFVTAYNLRYNRTEYLEALGSELCKRKIMKFVPTIPVKQQRLVRRLQQKRYGQEDTLDLETIKKAVDPNALRLQIAHRLGIEEIDKISNTKAERDGIDEINSLRMQYIGSAPFSAIPEANESVLVAQKNNEKVLESNELESLYSFPSSEFNHEIQSESQMHHIPSFNDPEVDALVHRKFKNYTHDDENFDGAMRHSLVQQSDIHDDIEATTSRIEYANFESAFEEYEEDVPHLDPLFDTHFNHHSL